MSPLAYNSFFRLFSFISNVPLSFLFTILRKVVNISSKFKAHLLAAGGKTCQSYGVFQVWYHGSFRGIETLCKSKVICNLTNPNFIGKLTLRAYLHIDDSIITCLFGVVCRFQYMSITILRSYGTKLLIRQNVINPALRNTIFIMRSLAQHHYSPSFSYSS